MGVLLHQQQLFYAGQLLEDDRTLADCNIPDGATIHLAMRLRGGPSVGLPVIFEAAGRQIQVEVFQNTTIQLAARMALALFDFQGDCDAVRVFSATQRLEPLCTIGYCDIKPDTILRLVPSRAAADVGAELQPVAGPVESSVLEHCLHGPDLEPPWEDTEFTHHDRMPHFRDQALADFLRASRQGRKTESYQSDNSVRQAPYCRLDIEEQPAAPEAAPAAPAAPARTLCGSVGPKGGGCRNYAVRGGTCCRKHALPSANETPCTEQQQQQQPSQAPMEPPADSELQQRLHGGGGGS